MNIKQAIIKTNDALVYILLVLVLITAILVAIGGGQPIYGTITLIVGWVIVAMLSGLWICISSIADNTQRQVLLTEQQNALLTKIYKQGQHNIEIQFPNEV